MTGPETAERNHNRDILMMQIRNPATRETLKREIPADSRVDYSGGGSRNETLSALATLARVEKGDIYKYILGIATVAESPDQLANAFGAIRALADWKNSGKDRAGTIAAAQKDFLSRSSPPMHITDEAKDLIRIFKSAWDQSRGDERFAIRSIRSTLMSRQGEAQRNYENHFAEAYLASIMDDSLPEGLRQAVLNSGYMFDLGSPPYLNENERRFDTRASFWTQAKPAWVFPEIFGSGTRPEDRLDPKDAEIVNLKKEIDRLRRRPPAADPAQEARFRATERENTTLKGQRDRLTKENNDLINMNNQLRTKIAELERLRGAAPSPDASRRISELMMQVQQLEADKKSLQESNRQKDTDLRRERDARAAAEREAARARADRRSGRPSPFEVLGITDRLAWDRADMAGKRRILDLASRPLRMKYHTDMHVEAAKNPVIKELLDRELVKINLAVEELEKQAGLRK